MKSFFSFPDFVSECNRKSDLQHSKLPFIFSEGYHRFLEKQGYATQYYFDKECFTMVGLRKSRFVLSAYLIFPPLENGNRLTPEEELSFYNRLISAIRRELKPDQIIPHVPIEVSQIAPSNSRFAQFGNVSVKLENESIDNLFSYFQSSNRNIIRKAIREGAYVKFGDEVFDDFYEIYADTHSRQQLYHDSQKDIRDLYESIKDTCICAVVYSKDHEAEGSLFVPYSIFGGYSYFAGSAKKPTVRGAVKLLHWEVIQELQKRGVERFVLGGARINEDATSKQQGMKDFKMSFGSAMTKGYLWKINYSPMKIAAFQLAVKLKMKLKGVKYTPDIIDQINKK